MELICKKRKKGKKKTFICSECGKGPKNLPWKEDDTFINMLECCNCGVLQLGSRRNNKNKNRYTTDHVTCLVELGNMLGKSNDFKDLEVAWGNGLK